MSYTVTQNTSFLTAAALIQKVISSAYFFLVARFIGEEVTGDYFNIFASIAIFTVIADFGLGGVLIREVSKNKQNANEYFNTIFLTKLVCTLLAILLMFGIKLLFGYPVQNFSLLIVAGVILLFDSLQNTFYGVFRAFNNVLYEAFALIGAQALTLIIGISALLMRAPLIWLVVAFAVPSFVSVLYASFALRRVYKIHFKMEYNKRLGKQILKIALPFALSGILVRLYGYSDSVIMNSLLSRAELGWWGMAYKISYVFQLLPVALGAAIYPAMSSSFAYFKDGKEIISLMKKSYHYLLLCAFPISAAVFALAPKVITFFLPRFIPSITVLQILILSIATGFLTFVHGAALNAINKQSVQTLLIASALVLSIVLNILLIPKFGIYGAALTAVVSNFVWCVLGYCAVNRFIKLPHISFFVLIQKILWPAFFMSAIIFCLENFLSIYISAMIGFIV
jgi:O-antigen/teichoic acid export membrane protein